MRGDGTRPAITTPDMGRARLLDLTRSLRRAGRMATGIDRVERAYLRRFLHDDIPVFGLIRTPFGYLLLDRRGMAGFLERLDGAVLWGRGDFRSGMLPGRTVQLRRAESDLRRLASARATRHRIQAMLAAALPEPYDYFNVGHSNITDRVMQAVKATGGQVFALVHDVIPLEFPQFQRPETIKPFRAKIRLLQKHADRLIYNSEDTKNRAEKQLQVWGALPQGVVAHLGVDPATADADQLPGNLKMTRPYFVCVGTIEPRKNHGFLLDIWDEMGVNAPPLILCGSRGWNNAAVFDRLDHFSVQSQIQEVNNLPDPALSALVQGAAGSLFPSHTEGFGLPPLEALQLGSRVLCNDLPVLREVLGGAANFIPVSEPALWVRNIKKWEQNQPNAQHQDQNFISIPTWDEHFKTVLRLR
jgi:glycosyltransferase involved in cell wall biosynthesis